MARLDKIHEIVKTALIKDGWTITADPFAIQFEELDLYVDLAAERVFAAERGNEKIAVEIKSFLLPSKVQDFKLALGQYEIYKEYMKVLTPERKLFLAIGADICNASVISYRIRLAKKERAAKRGATLPDLKLLLT